MITFLVVFTTVVVLLGLMIGFLVFIAPACMLKRLG